MRKILLALALAVALLTGSAGMASASPARPRSRPRCLSCTHNEGHARLKLYGVKKHGGTPYFSRLRVSGARTENGVWNWCFNIGEWQVTCPG